MTLLDIVSYVGTVVNMTLYRVDFTDEGSFRTMLGASACKGAGLLDTAIFACYDSAEQMRRASASMVLSWTRAFASIKTQMSSPEEVPLEVKKVEHFDSLPPRGASVFVVELPTVRTEPADNSVCRFVGADPMGVFGFSKDCFVTTTRETAFDVTFTKVSEAAAVLEDLLLAHEPEAGFVCDVKAISKGLVASFTTVVTTTVS